MKRAAGGATIKTFAFWIFDQELVCLSGGGLECNQKKVVRSEYPIKSMLSSWLHTRGNKETALFRKSLPTDRPSVVEAAMRRWKKNLHKNYEMCGRLNSAGTLHPASSLRRLEDKGAFSCSSRSSSNLSSFWLFSADRLGSNHHQSSWWNMQNRCKSGGGRGER